jgi:hypothetical protein
MPTDFKVMFVFFNDRMRTGIPLNISLISSALKAAGISTFIFDTSFYAEHERLWEEKKKEEAGIFKPIDYSTIGVKIKNSSLVHDLLGIVDREKPSLIGFSVYSQAKKMNCELAKTIKDNCPNIPIIFGGIHSNIEPNNVLNLNYVDFVCLGEGEEVMNE